MIGRTYLEVEWTVSAIKWKLQPVKKSERGSNRSSVKLPQPEMFMVTSSDYFHLFRP